MVWYSRRFYRVTCVLLAAIAGVACAGCVPVDGPVKGSPTQDVLVGGYAAPQGEGVDPGIFLDMVDNVAPIPGPRGQRLMRMSHEMGQLLTQKCYGKGSIFYGAPPGRFDQSRFADLDQITADGFSDPVVSIPEPNDKLANPDADCFNRQVPVYARADQLRGSWVLETVHAAHTSEAMTQVKRDTASCMREQTPFNPSDDDPTATFLMQFDGHVQDEQKAAAERGEGGPELYRKLTAQYTGVFAECSRPYFEALAIELEPKREELVEKHRELLEAAALELAGLGYVP